MKSISVNQGIAVTAIVGGLLTLSGCTSEKVSALSNDPPAANED